ncbi:MAG: 5'-nucleotidase, lipoprotein e(P4) family [Bacteroidales bacterium]
MHKHNLLLSTLMAVFLLASCHRNPTENQTPVLTNDYMQLATLWYQHAAECRALYYQSYNLARLRLDEMLKTEGKGKKAVVVDIDETVLDNSPYQAWCILNGKSFPEGWAEWTAKASAKALPGAVDFLNYVVSRGVDVFYITNRKPAEAEATLLNLQKEGFPQADTSHVLFRTAESNKETRRQHVAIEYKILLLVGDNLNDFTDLWEKQGVARRLTITDSLRAEFGKRFIILPNPMYGDWENAIYEYNYKLSAQTKDSLRKAYLKGF